MSFFTRKAQLANAISALWNHPEITEEQILKDFSIPPSISLGHLALPCFRAAKLLKKSPQQLSQQLSEELSSDEVTITAAGPYANIRWKASLLFNEVIQKVEKEKDRYGRDTLGTGKKVVVEYCSPNIAKKLAFHHIRSTLIGHTLSLVYQYLGFETVQINFVGDWGSQFGRLLASVELWGDFTKLSLNDIEKSMGILSDCYVKFHQELDSNPELGQRANDCLQRLEAQDPKTISQWKLIRDISVKSMDATLLKMGVTFDRIEGESDYVAQIAPLLNEVKIKANAIESEGAWIVEVPGFETPALIQKKDGTTLYLTRDIAAAIARAKEIAFQKMIYVVSEQQKLHFQLLFGTLKKMGLSWSENLEHVSFGTVLFGSQKMSTREGRVILLDEVLEQAKQLALEECTQKNPSLENKEEVAKMVGHGAVIFGELSAHRQRDIEFDWKKLLSFDGETGPYVQYSAVRCRSLLRKAAEQQIFPSFDSYQNYSFTEEEEALLILMSQFRSVLHDVIRENDPYYLTHYLIEVAKSFNRFYYRHPVLQATDQVQKQIRLQMVKATDQVITNGLNLLGMSCPEEM